MGAISNLIIPITQYTENIYFFNASLVQGGGSRFILVRHISLHSIDNFECMESNCRYRA